MYARQADSLVAQTARNAGAPRSIHGSERSPGEGNGNPHQYSCLENSMERVAWWAAVHGVPRSRKQLSDLISLSFMLRTNFFSPPLFFLIYLFFISWRLITLQYCSGFCHTLTWISHGFTCIPHPYPPSHLPLRPIPLGLPSAPGPSTCLMHPTWAGDLCHPW